MVSNLDRLSDLVRVGSKVMTWHEYSQQMTNDCRHDDINKINNGQHELINYGYWSDWIAALSGINRGYVNKFVVRVRQK